MKVRQLRKAKPYPRPFKIGASVIVPEYMGFFGVLMDTVRVTIKSSSQSGTPHHSACLRLINEARDDYIKALPQGTL